MNLSTRDRIATLLVAVATVAPTASGGSGWTASSRRARWPSSSSPSVSSPPRRLSCPASRALLRGSKRYLALTSILGLVALASGVLTIVNGTAATLAILVLATLVLWAAATLRHASALARGEAPVA